MTRRGEHGFAGLAEIAVSLAVAAILMPIVGGALYEGYQFLTSTTARSALIDGGATLLDTVEAQLQGAQPLGYCSSAASSPDSAAILETPLDSCQQTALGPPPPAGASSWAGYVSLPSPSLAACGDPQLTAGALVTATASCVGFFSYDYQTAALAAGGPFDPPELTYLWTGGGSLWVTSYLPTGSYTNAGCPAPEASCADPDWQSATSSTRFVGRLADAAILSYSDEQDATVPFDPDLAPPAVPLSDLGNVVVITVATTLSSPPDTTLSQRAEVTVSGDADTATSDGNE